MIEQYWQIWIEGYTATGEHGEAQLLNDGQNGRPGLIQAKSFDEAVEIFARETGSKIERNERNRYRSEEDYINRRSNWNIWACNLFPTEEEARKSFG